MKLKNLFTPAEKLWERGGESMQANSDEEALAYFNQAVAKDPHNAKYLTAVGQVSIKLRKWNDARLHLEVARTRGGYLDLAELENIAVLIEVHAATGKVSWRLALDREQLHALGGGGCRDIDDITSTRA